MSSLSVSPSSSGGFRRRGLISCLHSLSCRDEDAPLLHDQDMRQAMYRLIVGFYDQAYDRLWLPCKAMPDLFGLLSTAGLCLGLLDPVSNIILNTLALLPYHQDDHDHDTAAAKSKGSKKKRSRPGFDPWHEVAIRSYHGLTEFLVAYFGCLTEAQAVRYLYRADANLPLAVMLVHHDLYFYAADGEEAPLIDPESDRTQAALKYAATAIGHPEPDTLARVMAIRLPKDGADLDLLVKKMQLFSATTGAPLTSEDVRAIHRVLHTMMAPMCVANISHTNDGGLVVHVRQNLVDAIGWSETKPLVSTTSDGGARTTSAALSWDGTPISSSSVQQQLGLLLRDCLRIADAQKHILKCSTPCCEYLRSLEICLHAMIHGFYVTALRLLPTPSGSLMHSVLMAGHCYGSMDPVSNIVVNSICYNGSHGRPLPEPDRANIEQYNDILDPLSLLRLQVRSLKGLTELAAFADPRLSVAATCALENLCSAKCDIGTMLLPSSSSSSSSTDRSEKKNPFHEAAMAAGHPLPLQLGELHQQLLLMPVERNKLLSLITEAQTSGTVLPVDDIASVLDILLLGSTALAPVPVQAPELCVEALSVVSTSRSTYEERRSWFRSKIEKVLKDYTDRHFWEPKYMLDFIIGVEERNKGRHPFFDTCYHVNFMATCDPKIQRTLFYAEFWSYSSKKPKPEFCCPLPYAYAVGRCYYGVDTARKIVYPDDAKYIPDVITQDGTGSVDGMLEMDLVYFSAELDVELAENLNMLPNEDSDCDSQY